MSSTDGNNMTVYEIKRKGRMVGIDRWIAERDESNRRREEEIRTKMREEKERVEGERRMEEEEMREKMGKESRREEKQREEERVTSTTAEG